MRNGIIKCPTRLRRLARFLLFCVLACAPAANAKANYYYKVQLKDKVTDEIIKFKDSGNAASEDSEWSGWIYCESTDTEIKNSLRSLVPNPEDEYKCNSVTDEHGNEVWMKKEGQNDRALIGIAFKGRKEDNFEILQNDDWRALHDNNNDILTLDLSVWGTTKHQGSYYFANMKSLQKLILPENDFAIGDEYMFANCESLKEIAFNSNAKITAVGKGAFKNCSSLSSEEIQKILNGLAAGGTETGIEYGKIGDEAFMNCTGITTITIPATIGKIGASAFSQDKKVSKFVKVDLPAREIKIGTKAFQGCEMLKDVRMSKGVDGKYNQKITTLGEAAFADCRSISSESVNSILASYAENSTETTQETNVKYIPAYLFYGCNGKNDTNNASQNFTELTIPEEFGAIGEGAFGAEEENNPIKKITVSRNCAPVCGTPSGSFLNGPRTSFYNVVPNHVTVAFEGAACGYSEDNSTGYTSYMYDNSEFNRLLTKDIYSGTTSEPYDVVAQQHAIVRLHRTLKEGWNTLCLPFGATHAATEIPGGAKYYNCRLIQRALTPANNTKSDTDLDNNTAFMIAVYRDYVPDTKTFRFLHFQDYDSYPISHFEAFIVRMDKADIDKAAENKDAEGLSVYTFENVDLNYEWLAGENSASGNDGYSIDRKNIYGPGEMKAREWYGQAEPFKPFNDGKGDTGTYIFTGTFQTLTGTVGNLDGITTNDYYIQNYNGKSWFYQYAESENYGVRAFSGWFHNKPKAQSPKPTADIIRVSIVDGSNETTEIAGIDAEGNEIPYGNVYNMNGQLVRANAKGVTGLPKGLYIVDGKKIIVK